VLLLQAFIFPHSGGRICGRAARSSVLVDGIGCWRRVPAAGDGEQLLGTANGIDGEQLLATTAGDGELLLTSSSSPSRTSTTRSIPQCWSRYATPPWLRLIACLVYRISFC
jgi:hypothetical protein